MEMQQQVQAGRSVPAPQLTALGRARVLRSSAE
jgi:hypothetical protein